MNAELRAAYRELQSAIFRVVCLEDGVPDGGIVTSWCVIAEAMQFDDAGELAGSQVTHVYPEGTMSPCMAAGLLVTALSDRLTGQPE